jgi:LuxR family maltose regulon positive regulatory protein
MLALHETIPIPEWWRSYGYYFLGQVAYERNLLDSAATHLAQVEALRYRVNPLLYHDSLLGLALISQAQGDATTLWHYAARARTVARESRSIYAQAASTTFALRLCLDAGEDTGPLPTHALPRDTNQFWFEIPALTLAEYRVRTAATADIDAAIRTVTDELQHTQQHHLTRQCLALQAVHALALHRAGRREAGAVLDQALQIAAPLGLVRTFVDRGPLLAALLQASAQRQPQDPYRRRLVQALEAYRPAGGRIATPRELSPEATTRGGPAEATPFAGLTNRELEVLRMLQERLSNKEIAARLFVSTETVKTHARNLYRKLQVHGRRQVVGIARQ